MQMLCTTADHKITAHNRSMHAMHDKVLISKKHTALYIFEPIAYLSFLCGHQFARLVNLIAYYELADVFRSVSIYFYEPIIDMVEGLFRSDVIHHNDAVRASVISTCDCAKPFLTRCVPDL